MRYQLPQFIEVEDKIVGPFTFKQFVYIAGGIGLSYLAFAVTRLYLGLPFLISVLFPVPIILFALALAFYKVNNRPLIVTIEYALKYYFGNKLYLWKKEKKPAAATTQISAANALTVPSISNSNLKDVRWNLDISLPQQTKKPTIIESAQRYAQKNNVLSNTQTISPENNNQ